MTSFQSFKGGFISSKLSVPASISVPQSFRSAVAAPEPRPLGQDELQLGCGAARDQRPDQGQGVLVEVGLKQKTRSLVTPPSRHFQSETN